MIDASSGVRWLLSGATGLALYTYIGYPLILKALALRRSAPPRDAPREGSWPRISITVPAHNEEKQIRWLIESLLAIDYPADRRQIVIISDASTDRTDEIIREYADRGVELLRVPVRKGKTAAENAARHSLTGEIIINTDASIRIQPEAVKRLVAGFSDVDVGLVSGRDISTGSDRDLANIGESDYVGYEMWLRDLETSVSGIVGASGCLYAIRASLHRELVPEALSRDFAAVMIAREHGYRSLSEPDAICFVPRTRDLRREYRRKVRTMTRGMETLFFKRHLLNPLRYGRFSWMLFSHKICRWAVPWAAVLAVPGLIYYGMRIPLLGAFLAASGIGLVGAAIAGWTSSATRSLPRWLGLSAYLVLGNLAALHASLNALRGELNPIWEPTRREPAPGVE